MARVVSSAAGDTAEAVLEIAEAFAEDGAPTASDAVLVFASAHHSEHPAALSAALGDVLGDIPFIGWTGACAFDGMRLMEGAPGLSVLVLENAAAYARTAPPAQLGSHVAAALVAACLLFVSGSESERSERKGTAAMSLGNFSVSLSVKDIKASNAFYEKLGFSVIGGEASQNWLILQNQTSTIGLFQGMFEDNILTFNPGWDHEQNELADFTDVRELSKAVKEAGLETTSDTTDKSDSGPASFVLVDPDGNPVLIDQHR